MHWRRLGRNLVFSALILLVVVAIARLDSPATQRVEEYVAYVLTTEFNYESWLAERVESGILNRVSGWTAAWPWVGRREQGAPSVPAAADPVDR